MGASTVSNYLNDLKRELRPGHTTESSYRAALETFIESLREGINAVNEPGRVACGAPDLRVFLDVDHEQLTVGYIETKDLGIPLAEVEKSEQIKRYKGGLDNFILTNYLEFKWFIKGEFRQAATIGNLGAHGQISRDSKGSQEVVDLLTAFLSHTPESIGRAPDLAERLARHTRNIRYILEEAFKKGKVSTQLRTLYDTLKRLLIPHLDEIQFSDIFAQSLAYGLFAARCSHESGNFRLEDATREIPATNPFLRDLFHFITGPRFDEEPFAGYVRDLVQLLAHTDMSAVLADFGQEDRRKDPVMHFYETFLAKYDPKERERRGVYYTPESVVSYIVRSVDLLLKERFMCGEGLAEKTRAGKEPDAPHRVLILDPACGTGSFLYAVVNHIRESFASTGNAGQWSGYVLEHLIPRLFGFELLMAPYTVAHLKLGMQLDARDMPENARKTWACDLSGIDRLNIFLTDSLELSHELAEPLPFTEFIAEEVNAAAQVKSRLPIMVVLGNPPYSGHSASKSPWIKKLIDNYKWVDKLPLGERNPKWLQDDYVKFIRFGQWRIEQTGKGILAFITNHAYLDNPTFRGMRQRLMQSFDAIYILNLHGNAKKKERCPDGSTDQNVFDIQQGVAIGIFVRQKTGKKKTATVHYADLWGLREGKDEWLAEYDVNTTEWEELDPTSPFYLFIPQDTTLREEYYSYPAINEIMPVNSVGIVTARDKLTIAFTREELKERLEEFVSLTPEQARERFNLGKDVRDWKVELAQKDVRDSGIKDELIVPILYRPFDIRYTYYTGKTCGFICMPRPEVMKHMRSENNIGIITVRQVAEKGFNHAFITDKIVESRISLSNKGIGFVYPLYLLRDSKSLCLNFSKFLFSYMKKHKITSDIEVSNYVYAILHSPRFRERFIEFLHLDFPRIPFTRNRDIFLELSRLGDDLIGLHLLRSELLQDTGVSYPIPGNQLVDRGFPKYYAPGEKDIKTGVRLERGRVYINRDGDFGGQHFVGVPPEVWQFYIGGYQVCDKWLKARRGRVLSGDDIEHYKKIIKAISETIRVMKKIDDVIPGWPLP